MSDRPTAVELLDAVREFLERDVVANTEGRLSFHARVAANVVGIVGREIELAPALDAAEHERLRELLAHDGLLHDLNAELAGRIRDGSLDSRLPDVVTHVRESVRAKLLVANPRYLEA
ncbi:MAG: hypothetical protein JOZ99_11835 [Actinobacteria bacterium]|nr:hypothetical protein [Actinomycetota bacterium]